MAAEAAATFAEMAVATRLALDDVSAAAFALWLEAEGARRRADGMANLAARIGLSVEVTDRILAGEYRHAEVLHQAHEFFRRVCAREEQFRAAMGAIEHVDA